MRPLSPALFDRYVAPARPRAQLWCIVVALLVMIGVYLAWIGLTLGVLTLVVGLRMLPFWVGRLVISAQPLPLLIMLSTFIGMALAVLGATRLVHRRAVGTLFGPGPAVLRDFLRAAAVVAAVYAVMTALWFWRFDALANLDPWVWLVLLPATILALLIQTLAEELLFRAYLMQQLAARFRSAWIWLVVPAVIFGALHFDPLAPLDLALAACTVIGVVGLVAGDLTRRTGNIGAAWGMHFANNLVALAILATQGTFTGLALWRTPYSMDDVVIEGLLAGDLLAILAVWVILVRVVPR